MSVYARSPLGKSVPYPERYAPESLVAIERSALRAQLGIAVDTKLPFRGVDAWTAHELSWLDGRGKPKVGTAELWFPAHAPRLVESKSLKLYLNGMIQERFSAASGLRERIAADLSRLVGAPVRTWVRGSQTPPSPIDPLAGAVCIDGLAMDIDHYGPPRPEFLSVSGKATVRERLISRLLKTNCPITGQPDWASVWISYQGQKLNRAGLLRYLVSFRRHADFHEHCVERIFIDLMCCGRFQRLSVYARYTRRGGLDINPFRSSHAPHPPKFKDPRQ